MEKAGSFCLDCADLGHLEFLPSGDAALTRRATKASRLSAVVMRWSTRRNRCERQGILAEAAIEQAARECLSDAEVRARRREREQSAGQMRMCVSGVSSLTRSVSSSRVVRSTAKRLGHKCTSVSRTSRRDSSITGTVFSATSKHPLTAGVPTWSGTSAAPDYWFALEGQYHRWCYD